MFKIPVSRPSKGTRCSHADEHALYTKHLQGKTENPRENEENSHDK